MRGEVIVDHTDYNREWADCNKMFQFFRLIFSKKATKVLDSVEKFQDIDFEKLKIAWKKWIILDVDGCITHHHGTIYDDNLEIIKWLVKEGWKIVILSNMKKSNRYEELTKIWIEIIAPKFAKPDNRWFKMCLDSMNLTTEEVITIWDNFLTDWGSILAWIDLIKVKPIELEPIFPSFNRVGQKATRNITDVVAKKVWRNI